MDPLEVIAKSYLPGSSIYEILVEHSRRVAQKALTVAHNLRHLNPDLEFIHEASMLHDIGIFMTRFPELGCHGKLPYICHGYLGRALLEKAGYPRHGLVCERHVGVGITEVDIRAAKLPLPVRDMTPLSLEEKIICYADKFYSKNGSLLAASEKSVDQITTGLSRYGQNKVDRFLTWNQQFEGTLSI
jgi:uncharacterized protein